MKHAVPMNNHRYDLLYPLQLNGIARSKSIKIISSIVILLTTTAILTPTNAFICPASPTTILLPLLSINKKIYDNHLNHNHHYHCRRLFGISSLTASNNNDDNSNSDNEMSPSPKKTIELQRTIYKLNPAVSSGMNPQLIGSTFQMEERTYFDTSSTDDDDGTIIKKVYVLRGTPSDAPLPPPSDDGPRRRMTRVGRELFRFSMNEIDDMAGDDDDEATGTGGSTWESAIAMTLFFAARPDLLKGDCLELGSGVGLGGIMSTIAAGTAERGIYDKSPIPPSSLTTLTLTDSYPTILSHCITNAQTAGLMTTTTNKTINTKILDWYHAISIPRDERYSYNTIMASDCAYLYPDVKPLARTMAYLTCTAEEGGRLFHFGPFQRDAIRDLQTELERRYKMEVDLGLLEMDRFDMASVIVGEEEEDDDDGKEDEEEVGGVLLKEFVSKSTLEFLLIDAMHNEDFYGDGESFFLEENDDDRSPPELEVEYEQRW